MAPSIRGSISILEHVFRFSIVNTFYYLNIKVFLTFHFLKSLFNLIKQFVSKFWYKVIL